MKSYVDKDLIAFEKDYNNLMKDFQFQNNLPSPPAPEWKNPGDFIIKFSLYQESPNSITSTDTLVNFGV